MTKRSKAYRAAAEKIQSGILYTPTEAVRLAKATSVTKFDSTVDVVLRLGVDPRKADQMVRGTVSLPHGTGKTARVVVFAQGERAEQALAAGADEVGVDDLVEQRIRGESEQRRRLVVGDTLRTGAAEQLVQHRQGIAHRSATRAHHQRQG